MCGSTLIYYHAMDKIQALGGARYNTWLAKSTHIGMSNLHQSRSTGIPWNILPITSSVHPCLFHAAFFRTLD